MVGRRRLGKVLFAAAMAAGTGVARGQVSGTWVGANDGSWTDGLNWSSNPLYPDGGGAAVFLGSVRGITNVSLGTNVSVSRIEFDGPSAYFTGSTSLNSATATLVGPAIVHAEDVSGSVPYSLLLSLNRIDNGLGGTDGLVKEGPGGVYLHRVLYTGGTTINGGTLMFSSTGSGFGNSSNTLTLNGGAVVGQFGTMTLNQSISLAGAGGTIGIDGGGSNAGTLIVNGPITGAGNLHYMSRSSARHILLGGETDIAGSIDVQASVTLRDAGIISNASALRVLATLTLNNGATALSNRIGDGIPIQLSGGGIASAGTGGVGLVEKLGVVTLQRGLNGLGTGPKFEISELDRLPDTVLSVNTGALDDTLQIMGASPALSGAGAVGTPEVGILPWARQIGTGTTNPGTTALPVTVENGYIRRLAGSEYIYAAPVGVTSSNLRMSGSAAIGNSATVNSLTLDSGTFTGGSTLTISSGAVFATNADEFNPTISTFPMAFGSTQAVLHARSNTAEMDRPVVLFEAPISGTGGLIVAGEIGLKGASTYTGQTLILNHAHVYGDVTAGQAGPLGMDASPVVIDPQGTSSSLVLHPTVMHPTLPFTLTMSFDRDILVAESTMEHARLAMSAPYTWNGEVTVSGAIELNAPLDLRAYNASYPQRLIVSGSVSGSGAVTQAGTPWSSFAITGDNDFSGGYALDGGMLEVGSDTALGTGTFWITAGSISAINGPRTISNNIILFAAPGFPPNIIGSNPLTFAGSVNLRGSAQAVRFLDSATTTFDGHLFNGSFTKKDSGLMELRSMTLTSFTVEAGPVRVLPGSPASNVGQMILAPGASFDLNDNSLILDYSGSSPLSTIQQYLTDSRLFSSMAIPDVTTLAYAENSLLGFTTFAGQPVDSTALLLKYTWFGDATLDGIVDLRDLYALSQNWLNPGTWATGDFDGDGVVGKPDLTLLARNWQAGDGAPLSEALAGLGLPEVSVPEPVSLSIVTSLLLLRGRNHRANRRKIR